MPFTLSLSEEERVQDSSSVSLSLAKLFFTIETLAQYKNSAFCKFNYYRNGLRADAALEIEILSLSVSTENRDFGFGPSITQS